MSAYFCSNPSVKLDLDDITLSCTDAGMDISDSAGTNSKNAAAEIRKYCFPRTRPGLLKEVACQQRLEQNFERVKSNFPCRDRFGRALSRSLHALHQRGLPHIHPRALEKMLLLGGFLESEDVLWCGIWRLIINPHQAQNCSLHGWLYFARASTDLSFFFRIWPCEPYSGKLVCFTPSTGIQ